MSSATNASVVDSSQTSTDGISATAPRALVSPLPESAHASGEAHEDVSRTLFNGNEEINVEDIARACISVFCRKYLHFRVFISTFRTPVAASPNKFLSGHSSTGGLPLQET